MKVLVTGHKGYIGTHLISLLKAAGHIVTACDINLFESEIQFKIVEPGYMRV